MFQSHASRAPPARPRDPANVPLPANDQGLVDPYAEKLAPRKPKPAPTKAKSNKLSDLWELPPEVIRYQTETFLRGAMLGEGGFARVFVATQESTGVQKAMKVICKDQLKSSKTKSKLFGEIKIHQSLHHPNIISFEHCFEDSRNVYMQLELCANGSMLSVLRKRKRYTEPEARFYLLQLVGACNYMHDCFVIHRDLKLGNLMLDENLNLRVGDFGLAALVREGERKKTICGTPNYIAPEILFDSTNGHSFEVDIWSIGVILYTFLVGKPPFQTEQVNNIYKKIRANSYTFPPDIRLSSEAVDLIKKILNPEPTERPTLYDILCHPFMTSGPFPAIIPSLAVDSVPDFRHISSRASQRNFEALKKECGLDLLEEAARNALGTVAEEQEEESDELDLPSTADLAEEVKEKRGMEREVQQVISPDSPISDLLKSARKPLKMAPRVSDQHRGPKELLARKFMLARSNEQTSKSMRPSESKENVAPASSNVREIKSTFSMTALKDSVPLADPEPPKSIGADLYKTITKNLSDALDCTSLQELKNRVSHPPTGVVSPRVFILSWVDYTHRYGTAYALTDGTVGFYYNDMSTMLLAPAKKSFDYIASSKKSQQYTRRNYSVEGCPTELARRFQILEYFDDYMSKTLMRDVEWTFCDTAKTKGMGFLIKYYRLKNAVLFKMSNDVLQFNFFDHTKLIISQKGLVVTFVDTNGLLESISLMAVFENASKADSDLRWEKYKGILPKIKYCRDVLQAMSERRREAKA